ncbi:uncharacterized protein LOC132195671 [Neocloeon triangulifer]|uniref:uncharacterized protein LOC132195671 n=1 Tax=Neocloeon triangulifer TaxID=2078957 RepID=UPI00286F6A54|nr:uncharacterized protein LOC132195671 [Neocloeon triangulifer]
MAKNVQQPQLKCLHFYDKLFCCADRKGRIPLAIDPIKRDACLDPLLKGVINRAQRSKKADGIDLLADITETLWEHMDRGNLVGQPSNLSWFAVFRAAMLFSERLQGKQAKDQRKITLAAIKCLNLDEPYRTSLTRAMDVQVQTFNSAIAPFLKSNDFSDVHKYAEFLPECTLDVASAISKMLNLAIQVSGLKVLEKTRDNFAVALPFLIRVNNRPVGWFKVIFYMYRQVSKAAQQAMLDSITTSLSYIEAAKVGLRIREKSVVHNAHRLLARPLTTRVVQSAVITSPISFMLELPFQQLLSLMDAQMDECPGSPLFTLMDPNQLFSLITELITKEFFGFNLRAGILQRLYCYLVNPTYHMTFYAVMATEWALYLNTSALAKVELAIRWCELERVRHVSAVKTLSWIPAIVKNCLRLRLTKSTPLDHSPVGKQLLDFYLEQTASYPSWDTDFDRFTQHVKLLISDSCSAHQISAPKLKEELNFQTEEEINYFLDNQFFDHALRINHKGQLMEWPKSYEVDFSSGVFPTYNPPEKPELPLISVPAGTAVPQEDAPVDEDDWEHVSKDLNPLLFDSLVYEDDSDGQASESESDGGDQGEDEEAVTPPVANVDPVVLLTPLVVPEDKEEDAEEEAPHSDAEEQRDQENSSTRETRDEEVDGPEEQASQGDAPEEEEGDVGVQQANDEAVTPPVVNMDPVVILVRLVVPELETEDKEEDAEEEAPHSDAEEQLDQENSSTRETRDEEVDGRDPEDDAPEEEEGDQVGDQQADGVAVTPPVANMNPVVILVRLVVPELETEDKEEEAEQEEAPDSDAELPDPKAIDQEKTPAKVAPSAAAPPKPKKRVAQVLEDTPEEVTGVVTRSRAKARKIEPLCLNEPPKRARKRRSDPTAVPKVAKEGPKNKRGRKTKVRPVSQAPRALQANGQPIERRKRKHWQPDPIDVLPGDRSSNKRRAALDAKETIGYCLRPGANMALFRRH